jgi:hypothetical protein
VTLSDFKLLRHFADEQMVGWVKMIKVQWVEKAVVIHMGGLLNYMV